MLISLLWENFRLGRTLPLVEAEVKYFPVHHRRVFLFYSRKIQTLAFCSGDTLSEAQTRLFKDNEVWKTSRSCLAIIDTGLLEKAGLLDASDLSNERKLFHGNP